MLHFIEEKGKCKLTQLAERLDVKPSAITVICADYRLVRGICFFSRLVYCGGEKSVQPGFAAVIV
ncbi:hypothetical protein BA724_10105 [Domibacillus iocasae]|uniref:Uncharacterized protein n=1 Tax=Domibacillus iocasae TaxID=1714016 RepID=A0A1E7DPK4_9BACI|nr:hypothetical protein BA724_10105 [Domibacillus iocasae]